MCTRSKKHEGAPPLSWYIRTYLVLSRDGEIFEKRRVKIGRVRPGPPAISQLNEYSSVLSEKIREEYEGAAAAAAAVAMVPTRVSAY